VTRLTLVAAVTAGIAGPAVAACHSRVEAQSRMPIRDERTISRTLRFDGPGDRILDLRTIHGSIRVTAGDGSDVQLEARRTVRAETAAGVQDAEREVTLDVRDGAQRIGAIVQDALGAICGEPSEGTRRSAWRERYVVAYDFTARVPRRTSLRLCTINGGQIDVDGIDGSFEISNVNGGITIRNVRGAGSAHTINGPVIVSFLEIPRDALNLKTLNGDLEVTFPAGLSADLTLKTFNGDLLTDFEVQTLPQLPAVREQRNGGFVYRSDGSARVRVGTGGPTISLESFNGDVRVLKERR
jgi:hypothetical protein